jgi:hypothetical protein
MKGIPFSFLQPHLFRRDPTLKSWMNLVMEFEIFCSLLEIDGTIDMALLLRWDIGFSSNLLYQKSGLAAFFIG